MVIGDLEADGLLKEATRIWCGVFKDRLTKVIRRFLPHQIEEMFAYLDTVPVLCFHNGVGYDWPLMKKIYNYDYKGEKVDTLLMSRLQQPDLRVPFNCPNKKAGPHSVEAWGYRLERGKPDHDDWSQYSDAMLHRCEEDVEIQDMILDHLLTTGGEAWNEANKRTVKVFEILHEQEAYGWLMDRPFIDKSVSMLNHWMDRIDRAVVPKLPMRLIKKEVKKDGKVGWIKKPFLKSGGYSKSVVVWLSCNPMRDIDDLICGPFSRIDWALVDLNSGDQTKQFLLESGWIPAEYNRKRTPEGQWINMSPKLNGDDPFDGVEGWIGKRIAKRVQCRHRRSQIEGWIKNIREDGRLSQRVTGLTTTRRMKHGRIVNVPGAESFFGKWMRKCFTSKEGYKIVGTDSAGCQNRMLAGRVGAEEFTEILVNGDKLKGTSIHQVNQSAIREIAGIEVSYGASKNLNYAFMFGARDNKLGSIIGKGQKEGARIREALLSVAPGFEDLIENLTTEWRSNAKRKLNRWNKLEYTGGSIIGLDGSPIFIDKEHTLLVYLLQSDEAILMQYALLFLSKWCRQRGWVHGREYGFVANIHDEFQAEVREDLASDYAELADRAIVQAGEYLGIQCPHVGESSIGDNWYETH